MGKQGVGGRRTRIDLFPSELSKVVRERYIFVVEDYLSLWQITVCFYVPKFHGNKLQLALSAANKNEQRPEESFRGGRGTVKFIRKQRGYLRDVACLTQDLQVYRWVDHKLKYSYETVGFGA